MDNKLTGAPYRQPNQGATPTGASEVLKEGAAAIPESHRQAFAAAADTYFRIA
ncbi:MAG TPA: hypothetical protein VLJ86_19950 [Ramlibacter sp.]|nr:hypothetical protein [Ramlibacter sp.]